MSKLNLFLGSSLWEWSEHKDIAKQSDHENFTAFLEWRKIDKQIITPIESLLESLEKIELSFTLLINLFSCHKAWADCSKLVRVVQNILWTTIKPNELFEWIEGNEINTHWIIEIYKRVFSSSNNQLLSIFFEILEQEKNNLGIDSSLSISTLEEVPSLSVFINLIKEEIWEYLWKLYFLNILWRNDVLTKLKVWKWLNHQKTTRSSYIELPFFNDIFEEIENAERPWKVWQVVVKWPPWTWKTRIFEYLWEKKWRNIRVISMHQYVNYYELLVQNTNLSPAKNRVDSIWWMIDSIEKKDPKDLIEELKYLFNKSRDQFPPDYSLLDFVNNIFLVNWYAKSIDSLESLEDTEAVKKFAIKTLNFWRSEENFALLMNRKELVKWQLLSCIDNWEIPVLDELDKINEEEVDWILAFLDLETWKHHRIPWTEKEIFIPDWFWVYSTSNDKFKPAWPLWRRFNSVELNYLNTENTILYLLARILDDKLNIQFDEDEIDQLLECINIIEKTSKSWDYNMMDFSIRMLDNFISWFISFKGWKAHKTHSISNRSTYILDALKNAFLLQTEDIYWKQYDQKHGMALWEQKEKLSEKIKAAIDSAKKQKWIWWWLRISKRSNTQALYLLRKMNLDNPVLNKIHQELFSTFEKEWWRVRELNFSQQLSVIIWAMDNKVSNLLLRNDPIKNFDRYESEDFNITLWKNIFSYSMSEQEFKHSTDWWKTWTLRPCTQISVNSDKNIFLINEWDWTHTIIDATREQNISVKEHWDLKECYFQDDILVRRKWEEFIWYWNWSLQLWEWNSFSINKWAGIMEIYNERKIKICVTDKDAFENRVKRKIDDADEWLIELLSISIEDLGYEQWDYIIDSHRFDSTLNYIFVDVKSKDWEISNHIIKIS